MLFGSVLPMQLPIDSLLCGLSSIQFSDSLIFWLGSDPCIHAQGWAQKFISNFIRFLSWAPFLLWLISLIHLVSLGLPFLVLRTKSVALLHRALQLLWSCLQLSQQLEGRKGTWRRGRGTTLPSHLINYSSTNWRRRFLSLKVLAPVSSPCSLCHHCLGMAWGLGHERMHRREK